MRLMTITFTLALAACMPQAILVSDCDEVTHTRPDGSDCTDDNVLECWYDSDGDGFGDPEEQAPDAVDECPEGTADNDEDCDDGWAGTHPDAAEYCGDEADNDCDGYVDEDCDEGTDADGDGYLEQDDCDDTNADVNPGADEVCNEIDDDCDGEIDNDAIDAETWFEDADEDGFGNPDATSESCDQPSGYVDNDDDCDDTDADIYPGAEEVCDDAVDNDCDDDIDGDDDECDEGDEPDEHELCVIDGPSGGWDLAVWTAEDTSHWVTSSGGTAYVASPVVTSDDSDWCWTFESSMVLLNGFDADCSLWGCYAVGADTGSSNVLVEDGGKASVLEIEIDGVTVESFSTTSYDLRWVAGS